MDFERTYDPDRNRVTYTAIHEPEETEALLGYVIDYDAPPERRFIIYVSGLTALDQDPAVAEDAIDGFLGLTPRQGRP